MPDRTSARPADDGKIVIENVASPGHTYRVDRAKYTAMRDALLGALPAAPPGLTVAEARAFSPVARRLPPSIGSYTRAVA